MSAAPTLDPTDRRDALATRLFTAVATSLELQTFYLGERLGLYRALADGGPATASALAERAGIAPRYAREWLEQQAVAGVLDVDETGRGTRRAALRRCRWATTRSCSIRRACGYGAGIIRFPVGSAQRLPDLLEAFRTGRGIDWAFSPGPTSSSRRRRPTGPSSSTWVADWIGDLPDIAARLRDGTARVADVGCGTGWSWISIARHFPGVHVDGIDVNKGSIARAASNAAAAGVADRVAFLTADGAAAEGAGRYDLRHDLRGRPRHGSPRRGPGGGPPPARARRRRPCRRQADGRRLHGTRRRHGAHALCLQRRVLPAVRALRRALRGHRHSAATRRIRGDGPRRRLLAIDRPAHGARAVPVLPPRPVGSSFEIPLLEPVLPTKTIVDGPNVRCYPRAQVAVRDRRDPARRPQGPAFLADEFPEVSLAPWVRW